MLELKNFSYDEVVDAMFIRIKTAPYSHSIPLNDHVVVDVDSQGQILAIEILYASHFFHTERQTLANIRHWHLTLNITKGIVKIQLGVDAKKPVEKMLIEALELPECSVVAQG